ncbi:MAG: hypothetical protein JWL81_2421, partial [Verrucomicrobiales bacterium]|nr:hypothetical protein [Verrucomicrobiales bacterium]
ASNSPHQATMIPKIAFSTFQKPRSHAADPLPALPPAPPDAAADPSPSALPASRIRHAESHPLFRSRRQTHQPTTSHHSTGKTTIGVPVQAPIKFMPYHPNHTPAIAYPHIGKTAATATPSDHNIPTKIKLHRPSQPPSPPPSPSPSTLPPHHPLARDQPAIPASVHTQPIKKTALAAHPNRPASRHKPLIPNTLNEFRILPSPPLALFPA